MSDIATQTKTSIKIATPSMWKVVLLNDDFTPMDFVVHILTEIYNKDTTEAVGIMLAVHEQGRAVVALYTKEIAETKVRETMDMAQVNGHPLMAVAEEA
jgi:ATP-dependent Clp protease adaptor protein ClpS